MPVLHVINGLGTGGAERSLAEMIPHFKTAGFAPLVACVYPRREGVRDLVAQHGVPICFLAGENLPARAVALRRLICETRPAFVHSTIFESDLVGRLAAAGTGTPVLTSLVNTSYDPVRHADPNVRRWKLFAARYIDGLTARHLTDWFHAITYAVRDAAVSSLGIRPDRVTVIARGRDPTRLGVPGHARRARARQQLAIAPDAEVLLTVGRQEFQKGQHVLLRAIDTILQQRPRAVLLIAGRSGNATAQLTNLIAKLRCADRVRVLGHRTDVPELLCASDVFVFPSLYEGLGGALIEAMALGLPIVASRIPAIAEVVTEGSNALLVPAGQPEPLVVAIRTLLEHESLRRSFSEYGRQKFLSHFTLQHSAVRMAELFHHMAALRRAPSEPQTT